jgi:hypothetical protein
MTSNTKQTPPARKIYCPGYTKAYLELFNPGEVNKWFQACAARDYDLKRGRPFSQASQIVYLATKFAIDHGTEKAGHESHFFIRKKLENRGILYFPLAKEERILVTLPLRMLKWLEKVATGDNLSDVVALLIIYFIDNHSSTRILQSSLPQIQKPTNQGNIKL